MRERGKDRQRETERERERERETERERRREGDEEREGERDKLRRREGEKPPLAPSVLFIMCLPPPYQLVYISAGNIDMSQLDYDINVSSDRSLPRDGSVAATSPGGSLQIPTTFPQGPIPPFPNTHTHTHTHTHIQP